MLQEYSHFIKLLERENNSYSMSSCVYNVIRETVSYLKHKYFEDDMKDKLLTFYLDPINKQEMDDVFKKYKDNIETIIMTKGCHHCLCESHSHIFQILD
jgi:hypothetical protein